MYVHTFNVPRAERHTYHEYTNSVTHKIVYCLPDVCMSVCVRMPTNNRKKGSSIHLILVCTTTERMKKTNKQARQQTVDKTYNMAFASCVCERVRAPRYGRINWMRCNSILCEIKYEIFSISRVEMQNSQNHSGELRIKCASI